MIPSALVYTPLAVFPNEIPREAEIPAVIPIKFPTMFHWERVVPCSPFTNTAKSLWTPYNGLDPVEEILMVL